MILNEITDTITLQLLVLTFVYKGFEGTVCFNSCITVKRVEKKRISQLTIVVCSGVWVLLL